MALNMNYGGGEGGDIVPVVKYDARAGRIFRMDRADGVNTPVDISRTFKAVVDFENLEVGWILFAAGVAPDFQLVQFGSPFPARPSQQHKQGLRLMMKLGGECGGDVREMAGTAGAFMRGIDLLHDAYVAGEKENPGKLPVVVMKDTIAVVSKGGGQSSTNYQPVFEIVGWAPRPKDLVFVPKGSAAPVVAPASSGPPSTGSTTVAPPVRQAADEFSDFG